MTDDADKFRGIVASVVKARAYGTSDPEVGLAQARKAAEAICRALFEREIGEPGKIMLDAMLQKLNAKQVIPPSILIPFGTIQAYGNYGVHSQSDSRPVDAEYAMPAMNALGQVVNWFFVDYLKTALPAELRTAARPAVHPTAPPRRSMVWLGVGVGVIGAAAAAFILIPRLHGAHPAPAPVAPADAAPRPAIDLGLDYRVFVQNCERAAERQVMGINESVARGSCLVFELRPSEAAYVYLFEAGGKSKALSPLFPQPDFPLANPLPAGKMSMIPPVVTPQPVFQLDQSEFGAETLYVVASRRPLGELERGGDVDPRQLSDESRALFTDSLAAPAAGAGHKAGNDRVVVAIPFEYVKERPRH